MPKKLCTFNNLLKIYTTSIPVCSFIGFTLGSYYTLNSDILLGDKFIISMCGAIGGTVTGMALPIIVPSVILFTPFAIYDIYQKSNYVSIKK
jgi:hypothetical protein